ncbi:MAG: DNA polymerase III subunit gamma/tau [Roseburia sp.]|nr:DNA polymerase III subunit gamma/tau [Roseburia sp.]
MATLYRKYRSKRFDDVIGQDPIVTTLTNQIKLGRVGHAYLFTGSRGVGKTTCARIFARAVNCLNPVNGSPCGECEACKALAADGVDIIEMDAASNNGVDDARDIREKVKYLPVSCKYKVYIIDEVHMLTGGAFNALLKTIEEPPEHVIFILATTEPQKLPQTILSRCIRFDFKLVSTELLAKHIARIYDAEGIKYTEEAVAEIARLGEGSVRDALSIADMLSSAADEITPEIVLTLTGAGDSAAVCELFDRTAERDLAAVFDCVDRFAKSGKSMSAVCRQLTDYARNVLVIKSVGRDKAVGGGLINSDRVYAERAAASAEKFSMADISRILESFGAAEAGIKYSVNPRVFLETELVKLVCGADREEKLLSRIAALEKNFAVSAEQKKNNLTEAVGAPSKSEPTRANAKPHVAVEQSVAERSGDEQGGVAQSAAERNRAERNGVERSRAERRNAEKAGVYAPDISDVPPPEPPEPDPEPPPEVGYSEKPSAPVTARAPEKSAERPKSGKKTVAVAEEGEFLHQKASAASGLELLGKIARYLRKKKTPAAARAFDLLSRGVLVKERDDAAAFVAPDSCFLSMCEASVVTELGEAVAAAGIKKRVRIEKTDDDLYAEDLARARELFGRDGVTPRGKRA